MQLKKLAAELEVGVTLIKNFLKKHPAGKGRTFAGAEESLDREQERVVREAHGAGLLKRNRGATVDVDVYEEQPDPMRPTSTGSRRPRSRAGHSSRAAPRLTGSSPIRTCSPG